MRAAHVLFAIAVIAVVAFGLEYAGLKWMKFFAPRRAEIRREVFEETKSYVHGKIQDLSKYYGEYQRAETLADKEAIRALIQMQFAEFDAANIREPRLHSFLIEMRGY